MDKLRPTLRTLRATAQATYFGHPKGALSSYDYISRCPERWRPVISSFATPPVAPRRFGPQVANFEALDSMPALGLLTVPNGLILGPHGWVFTDAGQFLTDCAWPERKEQNRILPQSFGRARHLRGTCLSIATDWGAINHAHFMLDCLTRYGLFALSGVSLDEIDHIYCPAPSSDHMRDLMERMGIPLKKCVWSQEDPQVWADVVLATSYPGSRYGRPPELVDFLRKAGGAVEGGAKRIYVPRGNVRNIKNEQAILDVLHDFDFEIYDFKTHAGHEFFANAEIVVGAHGAGLANAIFSKPGTQLLDIIPSDHIFPFFRAFAESAGIRYGYLVGESDQVRPAGSFGPSPYDFWVDPQELRSAIEQMIAEPSSPRRGSVRKSR